VAHMIPPVQAGHVASCCARIPYLERRSESGRRT
jgi:hypothetical protein